MEGESVTNYYARTMEICNRMWFHGEKIEDVTIKENILHSMTLKFNYVIYAKESKDINELSLDEFQSSFLVHEQKMNRNSTSKEQALKTSTFISSSNFRGRDKGRGRGRGRVDQGSKDGGNINDNENYKNQ
ncbi:uncharacterized protein LOC108471615 [Gossypium arboreum]|uniref:uncharacterized protein LOC108471615 n=1 Tax=Gossypium arboreum TaxID=29729 RepID=UPI0008195894|nr:uncharacterized protein LOC108471615 [Gossypium arboreum]